MCLIMSILIGIHWCPRTRNQCTLQTCDVEKNIKFPVMYEDRRQMCGVLRHIGQFISQMTDQCGNISELRESIFCTDIKLNPTQIDITRRMRGQFKPINSPRLCGAFERVVHISEHGIYSCYSDVMQIRSVEGVMLHSIAGNFVHGYSTAIYDTKLPRIVLVSGNVYYIDGDLVPTRVPRMLGMYHLDYSPVRGYLAYGEGAVRGLGDLDACVPIYKSEEINAVLVSQTSTNMYVVYNERGWITVIDDLNHTHHINIHDISDTLGNPVRKYLLRPHTDIITCTNTTRIFQLDLWRADSHPMKYVCECPNTYACEYFDQNILVSADLSAVYVTDLRSGRWHQVAHDHKFSVSPQIWCVATQRAVYIESYGLVYRYM